MTKDISKLIEAVNRVGIQNISLLARMTGMPTETIRYTMKKRFPKMGLKVETPPNYASLGLERYFVSLQMTEAVAKSEATILKALSTSAFLSYQCHAAIDRRILAFFSVPVSAVDEFRDFLNSLVTESVLANYTCERLEWSRHPELKSKYYDFGTGQWSIDWEKVKKLGETPPAREDYLEPSVTPEIDSTDLLIIKELEIDSWRNIAEIARKLKLNERTIRWHYRKHVADTAQTSFVNWIPVTPKDFTKAMGLILEFNNVSRQDLSKLRLIFNNFPFSWFEAGRNDGYYQVSCALPAEHLMDSLRFLNRALGDVVETWKTWTIDLSTVYGYTIQYQNFKNSKGWSFNKEDALRAVMSQAMKIK
jgi:hypothetical protein